jgi:hypothetical protein
MILIDDNKTVIAGEALKVMAELALVLDRLMLELGNKGNMNMDYDEIMDRFIKLTYRIKEARGDMEDAIPQEVLKEHSLKDLFPEDFFEIFGNMPGQNLGKKGRASSQRSKNTSGKSSEDMLKEAMAKLNKAK